MKLRLISLLYCTAVLLAGCASRDPDRVFLDPAAIDARPRQPVLFPEYFLMEGFELQDHGRIPRTDLIGAGMSVDLELSSVRSSFNDVLHEHQWDIDTMEIGRQSFRILASRKDESVEIRGVQGSSGPSHVFLLYTP